MSMQNGQWNIIRPAKNGLFYLDHVQVEQEDTGMLIFTKIQQLCLPPRKHTKQRVKRLLYGPVVYTVMASKGNNSRGCSDAEAQINACEVFIKNKRYSAAYTLAIQDPSMLTKTDAPKFLSNRSQFSAAQDSHQTLHGLLVVQEVCRVKVIVLFGALLLLSIGLGTVVGLGCKDVELGVTVTAGMFQFLALLQWSYIWAIRR